MSMTENVVTSFVYAMLAILIVCTPHLYSIILIDYFMRLCHKIFIFQTFPTSTFLHVASLKLSPAPPTASETSRAYTR